MSADNEDAVELGPATRVWSVSELLQHIASYCDDKTLYRMMRVNSEGYESALPFLWETIEVYDVWECDARYPDNIWRPGVHDDDDDHVSLPNGLQLKADDQTNSRARAAVRHVLIKSRHPMPAAAFSTAFQNLISVRKENDYELRLTREVGRIHSRLLYHIDIAYSSYRMGNEPPYDELGICFGSPMYHAPIDDFVEILPEKIFNQLIGESNTSSTDDSNWFQLGLASGRPYMVSAYIDMLDTPIDKAVDVINYILKQGDQARRFETLDVVTECRDEGRDVLAASHRFFKLLDNRVENASLQVHLGTIGDDEWFDASEVIDTIMTRGRVTERCSFQAEFTYHWDHCLDPDTSTPECGGGGVTAEVTLLIEISRSGEAAGGSPSVRLRVDHQEPDSDRDCYDCRHSDICGYPEMGDDLAREVRRIARMIRAKGGRKSSKGDGCSYDLSATIDGTEYRW